MHSHELPLTKVDVSKFSWDTKASLSEYTAENNFFLFSRVFQFLKSAGKTSTLRLFLL